MVVPTVERSKKGKSKISALYKAYRRQSVASDDKANQSASQTHSWLTETKNILDVDNLITFQQLYNLVDTKCLKRLLESQLVCKRSDTVSGKKEHSLSSYLLVLLHFSVKI